VLRGNKYLRRGTCSRSGSSRSSEFGSSATPSRRLRASVSTAGPPRQRPSASLRTLLDPSPLARFHHKITGRFSPLSRAGAQDDVLDCLGQVLPASSGRVRSNVEAAQQNGAGVSIIAILAVLWTGSSVFVVISEVAPRSFTGTHLERGHLGVLKRQIVAVGPVIGIRILTLMSRGISADLTILFRFSDGKSRAPPQFLFRSVIDHKH
jgi:hypothetical protein